MSGKVPVSASVLRDVFNRHVEAQGLPKMKSKQRARGVLGQCGHSRPRCTRFGLDTRAAWQQIDLLQNVAQKFRYLQHVSCIPDDRAFNSDETSTRMLPVGDLGWGKVKAACRAIGDSRVQSTVALAAPMLPGEMYAQILYTDLTDRVLPMGSQPRGIFR